MILKYGDVVRTWSSTMEYYPVGEGWSSLTQQFLTNNNQMFLSFNQSKVMKLDFLLQQNYSDQKILFGVKTCFN